MRIDIRRKEKIEKVIEFAKRKKKIQEEVRAVLKKAQKKMKQQADRERKKAEEWKVMLSIKYLVFKKQLAKKLVDQYISSYIINEVVSTNAVKLQLLTSMRIHLVVNIS